VRLKFTIAYDGAGFAGWQSQAGGNTVQDLLEAAAGRIAGRPVAIHGSGRTDAGVHALGQSAHADVPTLRMGPRDWKRALNACLPAAIRVMRAERAAADFHARFDATGKIYRYHICTAEVLPPHAFRRAWHVPQPIDRARLDRALDLFVGRHDFTPFSANRGKPVDDPVREIRSITTARSGGLLRITFEGGGFLYKMVRMLTAAAVRVARGREEEDWIRALLAGGAGRSHHVAPADGLFLVRVLYR
jgi:tRNA pseudouridine38-40 synthase